MEILSKIRNAMNICLSSVTVLLFVFMLAVGTYQITARYFFNKPSTVSEELLTYSFTWMSLLAAAYVFGKRDHMRMGFLADQIHGTAKKALDFGIEVLIMAFAAVVMIYGGVQITGLTMSQVTASLQIPMGYVYSVVPISGILIVIFSAINMVELAGEKEVEV